MPTFAAAPMTYPEVIDYLYERLPMFTRDGASAVKKDLENTLRMCEALGDPHKRITTIHVAGTNGKGSTSHMLAAILQQAGYKTGLYTSPHLLDFRERIRINGEMIPEKAVVGFVEQNRTLIESVQPSFFEVTAVMAFDHFAREGVSIAVIETGLGGRLDSTNVITPILSVITNIGYDHMYLLGDTLREIAAEKAGIIKPGVPVIIGERQPEVAPVFQQKATDSASKLVFASDEWQVGPARLDIDYLHLSVSTPLYGEAFELSLDLKGSYQRKNLPGVLSAVRELQTKGYQLTHADVEKALRNVQQATGLMGRWQTLQRNPLVVCDTGHNEDGWREIMANIASTPHQQLHIVLGVMQDKDLPKMLPLLPAGAHYYFCQVDMPRALAASVLKDKAVDYQLNGDHYATVADALAAARSAAAHEDLVFVGGSTFVVADLLALYRPSDERRA